jgi:7,8-dihydropterin-6-yl-methyl-4-(beta-D-ribofuranosyl)aminobenzene 5'-phosphate synthase
MTDAPIEITVVYDNFRGPDELEAAHGFACVVRGLERTLLFDAGWSGPLLLDNLERLGIAADTIDVAVLSHMHWDHAGGLDAVLRARPGLEVHVPRLLSASFGAELRRRGAVVVDEDRPHAVAAGAITTGVLRRPVAEQALVLLSSGGPVLVTGCAHPGVGALASAGAAQAGGRVAAVLGGFHLVGRTEAEVRDAIAGLPALGVRRIGPCHCSGEAARRIARDCFPRGRLDLHVGARITFGI